MVGKIPLKSEQKPPANSQRAAPPAGGPGGTAATATKPKAPAPPRLTSLDAYRGFIMTMLAASGFGIFAFTQIDAASPLWEQHDRDFWQQVGFHFEHPEWESKFGLIGVSFWDLIQPAFMFMVGVAMPFSYRRREAHGQKPWTRHVHAAIRALVLVLLGVFLYSQGRSQTNWIFPNVLCQIGLGYLFAYALLGVRWYWQTAAIAVILAGYWALFYFSPPPEGHDFAEVLSEPPRYIDPENVSVEADEPETPDDEVPTDETPTDEGEENETQAETDSQAAARSTRSGRHVFVLFDSADVTADPAADQDSAPISSESDPAEETPSQPEPGEEPPLSETVAAQEEPRPGNIYAGAFAPWSKNSNAAHFADVRFLNMFPRPDPRPDPGDEGEDDGEDDQTGRFLFNRGGYQTLNFVPSIATMLLGVLCGQILLLGDWGVWKKIGVLILMGGACFGLSLAAELVCPVVKHIWTPSWVLFSGAYVIWGLALFYMLFDALPFKWLAFPLVVIGMNSILIYLMGELMSGWTIQQIHTHLGSAINAIFGSGALHEDYYQPIFENSTKFLVFWLIAFWLYRQRYFIRI